MEELAGAGQEVGRRMTESRVSQASDQVFRTHWQSDVQTQDMCMDERTLQMNTDGGEEVEIAMEELLDGRSASCRALLDQASTIL